MHSNSPSFSIDDYDFVLPPELIAQAPVEPRDSSRLLVIDRAMGAWKHHRFSELPELLDSRDIAVANDTRVLPARLLGRRLLDDGTAGGRVEFLLLEEVRPFEWEGMFHAAARHKPGVRFEIPTPDGRNLRGELIRGASESEQGTVVARFDRDPVASGAGAIPLPPYIERSADASDDTCYQTIYAESPGSAAAPTAGLHFTADVRSRLEAKGIGWETVTLHVGLGTFRPVKSADIREHRMHDERYEISESVATRLTAARREGRRILAVGTTSVRTLESAWDESARAFEPGPGRTRLFIHPGGREIRAVDRILTNFHLPKSTLLMMISAFAGRELIMAAYAEAISEKYRFFSYGDSMLIL